MKSNRILSACMALVMLFGMAFTMSGTAAAAEKTVDVRVNGYLVKFPDQKPYINEDQRTLIPVRFVAEALGAEVNWNAEFQGAEIKKGNLTIQLPIGSKEMKVIEGDKTRIVTMDTEAIKTNGRTLVPIRFVAEAMGAWVSYAPAFSTVEIYDDVLTPDEINELQALPFKWDFLDEMKGYQAGNSTFENLHEYGFRNCGNIKVPVTFKNPYDGTTWVNGEGTSEELANLFVRFMQNSTVERYTSESYGASASFRTDASCLFTSPSSTFADHPFINYGYLTITFDDDANIAKYKQLYNTTEFGNIQPGKSYTYIIESIWMINVATGIPWNMGRFERTNGAYNHW